MRTSPTQGVFSVVSPPGPKPPTSWRPIATVGLPLLPAGVPLALYGFVPVIAPVYAGLLALLLIAGLYTPLMLFWLIDAWSGTMKMSPSPTNWGDIVAEAMNESPIRMFLSSSFP